MGKRQNIDDCVIPLGGSAQSSLAVYGSTAVSQVAFTRPNNTTAYDAADLLGVADAGTPANAGSAIHTIASIGPSGGVVLLRDMRLNINALSVPAGMTTFRVWLFNASPTAILDNAAFVGIVEADKSKYLGFVDLTAATDRGALLDATAFAINKTIKLATGSTSLYALIVTDGGFTPAASTVFTLETTASAL